jgi:hypothetical protein
MLHWFGPVEVEDGSSVAMGSVRAQPNPFRDRMRLTLALGGPERVTVDVLDLSGRRVARLHDGVIGPEPVELEWDGTRRGRLTGAGVYFLMIRRASGDQRLRVVKLN